ncbi:hypothetical protein ABZ114_10305 [Streptomyces albidoflavus]|uniref:hypothetical protein n=1 Tax=Streptomyces TaxID=1883 RepID=UPI00063EC23F|nr:hypothetical protein [Streptomyces sp. KE1]KLJ00206.1 hypothetical protein WQ59_15945 [Streptomyces sp. KE1]
MAKDSDVIVNVDLLVDSEKALKGIGKALRDLENRRDDMRGDWGHDRLADAMDDFVDNWDDRRAKMIEGAKSVQSLVKSTIDGFTGADAALARELRKAAKS